MQYDLRQHKDGVQRPTYLKVLQLMWSERANSMPRRRAAGLPAKKISQGLPVSRVRHDRRGDGERRRRSSPSPPRRDEEIPKCPPIHKRLREVSVASTYSCCYPPDSELGKTPKHETAVDQQLNRRLKERLSNPRRSSTKAECRRERPPMRHVMDVVVMEGRTKTDESHCGGHPDDEPIKKLGSHRNGPQGVSTETTPIDATTT